MSIDMFTGQPSLVNVFFFLLHPPGGNVNGVLLFLSRRINDLFNAGNAYFLPKGLEFHVTPPVQIDVIHLFDSANQRIAALLAQFTSEIPCALPGHSRVIVPNWRCRTIGHSQTPGAKCRPLPLYLFIAQIEKHDPAPILAEPGGHKINSSPPRADSVSNVEYPLVYADGPVEMAQGASWSQSPPFSRHTRGRRNGSGNSSPSTDRKSVV